MCHGIIHNPALGAVIANDPEDRHVQMSLSNLRLKTFADADAGLIGEDFRDDHALALFSLREDLLGITRSKEEPAVFRKLLKIHGFKLVGRFVVAQTDPPVRNEIGPVSEALENIHRCGRQHVPILIDRRHLGAEVDIAADALRDPQFNRLAEAVDHDHESYKEGHGSDQSADGNGDARSGIPDMAAAKIGGFTGDPSEQGRKEAADALQDPWRNEREPAKKKKCCRVSGERNTARSG